jgi:hypothetical protein
MTNNTERENSAKPLEQVVEYWHLDAELIDRCKEVRRWQKSGILVENSRLEAYAEKYYSGLENNLLNAEADTAAQAMQAIIDLSAATAPSLCTAEGFVSKDTPKTFVPCTPEEAAEFRDNLLLNKITGAWIYRITNDQIAVIVNEWAKR